MDQQLQAAIFFIVLSTVVGLGMGAYGLWADDRWREQHRRSDQGKPPVD